MDKTVVPAVLSLPDFGMEYSAAYDAYRIEFPKDCAYRGRYFYIPAENVRYENDTTVCLKYPADDMIAIMNPEEGTYRDLTWLILELQIGSYMRSKRKIKLGENDYE